MSTVNVDAVQGNALLFKLPDLLRDLAHVAILVSLLVGQKLARHHILVELVRKIKVDFV